MTDIVDRLRALNADFLHEEAADEIERLRGALRQIADGWAISMANMQNIARAALGENRHD